MKGSCGSVSGKIVTVLVSMLVANGME
jgi:hypothetical protein